MIMIVPQAVLAEVAAISCFSRRHLLQLMTAMTGELGLPFSVPMKTDYPLLNC